MTSLTRLFPEDFLESRYIQWEWSALSAASSVETACWTSCFGSTDPAALHFVAHSVSRLINKARDFMRRADFESIQDSRTNLREFVMSTRHCGLGDAGEFGRQKYRRARRRRRTRPCRATRCERCVRKLFVTRWKPVP